jgi:hypothetical protein
VSTRPIREALDTLMEVARNHAPDYDPERPDESDCRTAYEAAMEAVAVIENMAKTLVPGMTEEIRASRLPHAASVLESIAEEAP